MKYRSDIDGLRALAVAGVVLFHAFPHKLPGGFTGVDVFFVISGFLISRILYEQCALGTFTFRSFYARRVRRIFPALLTVLLCSLVFGWFALSADQYRLLGKHALSGLGFVINFVLVNEAGYFDVVAETKPLLHLWSLAVEEQYYLLWPCLLLLCWSRKAGVVALIIGLIIASFVVNIVLVNTQSAGAYFLPFGRFWEMLAGSLLAWVTFKASAQSLLLRQSISTQILVANTISIIGLTCVVSGYFAVSKSSAFPGYWALLPVMGSLAIIAAGPHALLNRWLFSHPLAVWGGKISYPLYLWHWPVLSFLRILKGTEPDTTELVIALALSVLLSWLTHVFIEKPAQRNFQNISAIFVRFLPLSAGMAAGAALIAFSVVSNYPSVEPEKFSVASTSARCSESFTSWNKVNDNACRFQQAENTIAVIGDSHAGHLFDGLAELAAKQGDSVALFPASCQSPLRGISSGFVVEGNAEVQTMRANGYLLIEQALNYVLQNDQIQNVVLAHSPRCDVNIKDTTAPHVTEYKAVLENGFKRTLSALHNKHKQVLIVLDNPFLKALPNHCLENRLPLYSQRQPCIETEQEHRENDLVKTYNAVATDLAKRYENVKVVDLASVLCEQGVCKAVINDTLLYKDQSHLSVFGSRYVAPYILQAMN